MQKYNRFESNKKSEQDIEGQIAEYRDENVQIKKEPFRFLEAVPFGVERIVNARKDFRQYFQTGEIFDGSQALAELRSLKMQGDKKEFKLKFKELKNKIFYQKEGIADIENRLFKILSLAPDSSGEEVMELVKYMGQDYALNEKQLMVFRDVLKEYEKRHKAIKKIVEECKKADGMTDGKELFYKVFRFRPKGNVYIVAEGMVLYFRLENLDDYAYIYSGKYQNDESLGREDVENADKSGGCFLPGYRHRKELFGMIALEKLSGYRAKRISDEIYNHESKHAYNRLIEDTLYNHYGFYEGISSEQSSWRDIESSVKNEIIAYAKTGTTIKKIREKLLEQDTIYGYGHLYKNDNQEGFSEIYIHLIDNALNAYVDLINGGYSKEEAQLILFKEDLRKWSRIVKYLVEINFPRLSTGKK